MAAINKSRHDLFIEIEKPLLKPLPEERFVIASWTKAKVHIDYHVKVEKITLVQNTFTGMTQSGKI